MEVKLSYYTAYKTYIYIAIYIEIKHKNSTKMYS